MPFGVNVTRSQVLYQAAQVPSFLYTTQPVLKQHDAQGHMKKLAKVLSVP